LFIEDVYGLPGLGQMMTRGLQTYDLPVLLGVVVFMTFSILVLNLLIDVCYTFCDPRVRAHASIDKEDRVDVRGSQPAPAPRAARTGSTARQGPHQGAQKSTTTGSPASRTSRWKLSSVTSRTATAFQSMQRVSESALSRPPRARSRRSSWSRRPRGRRT